MQESAALNCPSCNRPLPVELVEKCYFCGHRFRRAGTVDRLDELALALDQTRRQLAEIEGRFSLSIIGTTARTPEIPQLEPVEDLVDVEDELVPSPTPLTPMQQLEPVEDLVDDVPSPLQQATPPPTWPLLLGASGVLSPGEERVYAFQPQVALSMISFVLESLSPIGVQDVRVGQITYTASPLESCGLRLGFLATTCAYWDMLTFRIRRAPPRESRLNA